MKKDLAELKKNLERSPYKKFELVRSNGKVCISRTTGKYTDQQKKTDLDSIFTTLESLPKDNYTIRAFLNGSPKSDSFDYPVTLSEQNTLEALSVLSQPSTGDLSSAERLGRLEAENAFLKEQLDSLKTQLAEGDLEDEYEDPEEILEEEAEPAPGYMELLAPAIPGLVDRVLSILDVYLDKQKAKTAPPQAYIPQQPIIQEQQQPILEIDYDKLADLVAKKLESTGNY
jgi:hypothetical protein